MGTKTRVPLFLESTQRPSEKRIPKHGDENGHDPQLAVIIGALVKKESPNMGTKTFSPLFFFDLWMGAVKKGSPNMGTKTNRYRLRYQPLP